MTKLSVNQTETLLSGKQMMRECYYRSIKSHVARKNRRKKPVFSK